MTIKKIPLKTAATFLLSATLLAACANSRVNTNGNGNGQYASHAPNNYRVTYDRGLGMYVVHGPLHHFWDGTKYYRFRYDRIETSTDFRVWSVVAKSSVPQSLRARNSYSGSSSSIFR